MWENELMPTAAIHRNIQLDLWEPVGCLRPVCSITLLLCNLDLVMCSKSSCHIVRNSNGTEALIHSMY